MIVGAARHTNGGHAKNRGWKSPDHAAHRRQPLRFGFTSRRQQLPTIASSSSTQLQSLHAPASKNHTYYLRYLTSENVSPLASMSTPPFYDAKYYRASPTWNTWVKCTCAFVHALKIEAGFYGKSSTAWCSCFAVMRLWFDTLTYQPQARLSGTITLTTRSASSVSLVPLPPLMTYPHATLS